jgi:hypothetical protein
MDVGTKLTVTPVGWPVADSVTAELNPYKAVVVIVEVPLVPCPTETEAGDAESEKVGARTTSETATVCVTPPPIPVTVIGYVPGATVEPTATVIVVDPLPGAGREEEPKVKVVPLGWPLAVRAIVELKLPKTDVVIVVDPLAPGVTERELDPEKMAKLGTSVSAFMSAVPFGLPNPVAKS